MPLHPQAKILWSEIRNRKCTDCALHESAQKVCLIGDGPVPVSPTAGFAIIGEAPGYREDDVGRPFSGKSGQLLDATLERHGLSREQAFVTNVAKCRPPENRTPTRTEIKACRPYLDKELEAVQPPWILLLGNSALSVIKKSGITRHRGEIYQFNGSKVFPTVHPAAVLRNPRYTAMFEADIATFSRLVRGLPGPIAPRTILVKNKKGIRVLCEAILKAKAVAYDLETNGFEEKHPESRIATIAIAVRPDLVFVVPIHHPEGGWKDPQRALDIVGNALVYTDAKRVAHNAKFDDRWLRQFGVPIHADFDTMIAAHVLDENRLKGLKPLAQILLGVDPWKDVDLSNGGAMTENLKSLARYNGKDAAYTLGLYYYFRDQLLQPENRRTARLFTKLMMPASSMLTEVEAHGVYLDTERLANRRIEIQSKLKVINKELTKIYGAEANWNSPRVLAELLFDKLGMPVVELTKGGARSTREAVLLRLKHDTPVADLILQWRTYAKYESTYLGKWTRSQIDGRIYPNYKITGTVTGRLSSGKENAKDPRVGLQQVPREPLIRGVIGAPPGWKLVEADYSQVELRIAAHYAQDPNMMRIFLRDGDIHMEMAMELTGKPASAIKKEERKKAKGVNFGYLFGMGSNHFIDYAFDNYDLIVSDQEARESRKAFFRRFYRLPAWHQRQRRLVQQYKRVQSAIGRTRHLPDVDSDVKEIRMEAERQAINSPVQGLASDMMLLALTILHNMMPPDEAKIVGTVHDSGLFEIREDRLDYWVPIIKDVMENLPLKQKFGAELSVPIRVDVSVGDHWGEGEEYAA